MGSDFWDRVLRRLAGEVPRFSHEAWLCPLAAQADGEGLRLLCPTVFHRDRVRERFLRSIEKCAAAEAGRPVSIDVDVACEAAAPHAPEGERSGARPVASQPTGTSPAAARPPRNAVAEAPPGRADQRPLPYTFDNFVVGPCNALAREASLAVARGSQSGLNPLYLASGTGLGKTHLARAIVDEARRAGATAPVYTSAEGFTNEFTASIRARETERFKRRFRERCDFFVVEDVQFFRAKTATQLELFHTVTHLIDAGARVVITGDRIPRELDLEDRLRSQLGRGLVAELEPPDAAVRREILRAKSAAGGVRLPADCLEILIEKVRGNVRELEAALIQLVVSASLLKRPIDLDLTREAIRKVAPETDGRQFLDPDVVIDVVCGFFGTPPGSLAVRSRRRDVLLPRQLAMYLCRRYTNAPASEIARRFGREHPSVTNAVRVIERRILEHAPLRYQVEELSRRLESQR